MPLNTPEDSQEVTARSKVDVQNAAPQSNPFLRNSWLAALITGFSNRIFDFYLNLDAAVRETFFDTSTGEFLARQASWFDIFRLDATVGRNQIVIPGVPGTPIPADTEYKTTDGVAFTVDSDVQIINSVQNITSLTQVGGLAAAVTGSDHGLSSNIEVDIDLADQTEYNGTFTITVTSPTSFTYVISGSPVSPATGSPTIEVDRALASMTSVLAGSDAKLDPDTPMTITQSIAGADDTARVSADGTSGGTAQESQDAFRERFLFRVRNPIAHFNVAEISNIVLAVAGNTRVFVQEVTPLVGQVTVFFTRDNEPNPLPSAADRQATKDEVLKVKPANTSDNDVIFPLLAGTDTDFGFTSIAPDTPTMRTAVRNQLASFFATSTDVETDVKDEAYITAIFTTIDTQTGERLTEFTLSTPTGDIIVGAETIATLGAVTFS